MCQARHCKSHGLQRIYPKHHNAMFFKIFNDPPKKFGFELCLDKPFSGEYSLF